MLYNQAWDWSLANGAERIINNKKNNNPPKESSIELESRYSSFFQCYTCNLIIQQGVSTRAILCQA